MNRARLAGSSRRVKEQTAGFTLLEVLIALAILAIALSAATRAAGMASDTSSAIKEHLLSGWIAKDRVAQHRARRDFPSVGTTEDDVEEAGESFHVQENVSDIAGSPLRRVEVKVFRGGEKDHASAVLAAYLVQP